MSTPITWIMERERPPMSTRSWRRLTGQTSRVPTPNCVRERILPTAHQVCRAAIGAGPRDSRFQERAGNARAGSRRPEGFAEDTTTTVQPSLNQPPKEPISGNNRLIVPGVPAKFLKYAHVCRAADG